MLRREAETLPSLLGSLVGDAPALLDGSGVLTFAQLEDRSARVAGGLRELGVKRGDRVALWLPNRPQWLLAHLALARLGALTVAINTRFRAHEAGDILQRSGAAAIVVAPALEDRLDAPPPIVVRELPEAEPAPDASAPELPCVAFTSSGTTGRPKLVAHDQRGIAAHARAVARGFGYDEPGTTVLSMLPLCGVFGYDSALGALAGGAPVVLQERFDGEQAARLIERHGVTHANGSDTMLLRVLDARPDPPLREAGFAAFDTDPRRVIDAADAAGTTAYMCYGSTEVQALLAHAPKDGTPERRAVAGGVPVHPDTEVRTSDEGELEVRGPSVTCGYLGDEAPPFTSDGFLPTGDLGRMTDDGFAFEGRRDDALRLRGFLVSPREIEAFLEEQDGVAEAAVVAADGVVAFITGDAREDELIERCRERLASFKVPRRVIALDALPVTESANGRKVRRAELRRIAAQELQPTTTE
jgi:fatty-acyl-CoA synthase